MPKSLKPTRQVCSTAASAPAQDVSPQEVEKVFIASFSAKDITILLQIHVWMHDRYAHASGGRHRPQKSHVLAGWYNGSCTSRCGRTWRGRHERL